MALRQGSVQDVINAINEQTRDDRFTALAITARQRQGKSRLAWLIARGVYPQFTYEENYLGNPKPGITLKKLIGAPLKSVCWLDEAEKVLSVEKRWETQQWDLHQYFNQFASHNKIIIFCTPSFKKIDPRWRNSHISLWIYLPERGMGILMKNRDIQSSNDVWGLRAMFDKEKNMKASEMTTERIIQCYDSNPSALFYFRFPDWENEEEKAEYTKQKEASQEDFKVEMLDKKDEDVISPRTKKERIGLGRLSSFLNLRYRFTIADIGRIAGYGNMSIRKFIDEFANLYANNENLCGELPAQFFLPEHLDAIKNLALRKIEE